MIDGRLLMIADVVEDDAEVDMCEELAGDVRNLLVLVVELDGLAVELGLVRLAQLHIVHADAVVREGLSVHVADRLANLQEPLVLLDCLLVLSKVVKEDSRRVIGTALISGFSSAFASKSENVIILESLLSSDTVVRIRVSHVQSRVILQYTCGQFGTSIKLQT